MKFEGAFFMSVGPEGPGAPARIAECGPQFLTMIGAGSGEFIAAGDQRPLTLLSYAGIGEPTLPTAKKALFHVEEGCV